MKLHACLPKSVILCLSLLAGAVALVSTDCAVASSVVPAVPSLDEGDLLSDDAIDSIGDEVMRGHEFRSVRRRVLEQVPEVDIDKGFLGGSLEWMAERIGDVFRAIADFFNWLFSGLRSPSTRTRSPSAAMSSRFSLFGVADLLTTIAIIAIIAILIVIIAMVVKSIDAKKQSKGRQLSGLADVLSDIVSPPGELAASTYESRAIRFAATGDYRAAIRELLLGSMSWIERAGLIRYRRGLTNRDYLRAVGRRQDKRNAFLATATQFEFVYFGRRVPTAEMFEQCLAVFRGAFHEEETPTAAV